MNRHRDRRKNGAPERPGQDPTLPGAPAVPAVRSGPIARDDATAQLQAIVDHVKDAILTVDDSGLIETLNRTAERIFGYSEDEARGRRLDLLIPSLARHAVLTEALDELSEYLENTQIDLAPRETRGRRHDGTLFDVELGVSKVRLDDRQIYIACLRDTTDRKLAEAAIRESEARYRTLVENAPEVLVVLDMDLGRFVECNENAVRFFKMTREELLAAGPAQISAEVQADGTPSAGVTRGYLDRALAGEAPCFEWLHRDALGQDIPCEVRLVRLPSSGRRLIRGSITDITERKRSELLAAGERRVLERITGNADLPATLEAIIRDRGAGHPGFAVHRQPLRRRTERAAFCRRQADAGTLPRHAEARRRGAEERLLRRSDLPAAAGRRGRHFPGRTVGAPARAGAGRGPSRLLVHADPVVGRSHDRHGGPVFPSAPQPAEA